ncbi:uncharacterized protein LOC134527451 isoform X2 [Bacillus rossius redtenbacheri]|uniref:uncharacterized protein LOC134527451 isoform X2 n=1 Tax=Bacillus rossius redtenbacheri TaxID=93214 RepID=UPI002FDCE729
MISIVEEMKAFIIHVIMFVAGSNDSCCGWNKDVRLLTRRLRTKLYYYFEVERWTGCETARMTVNRTAGPVDMWALCMLMVLTPLHYASGAGATCECAVLFTSDVRGDRPVFTSPSTPLSGCYDSALCKQQCAHTLTTLGVEGDPQHLTAGGSTVADYSCKSYGKDIHNGQPAGYYKLCGGKWQHIQDAKFKLCCKDGSSVPC